MPAPDLRNARFRRASANSPSMQAAREAARKGYIDAALGLSFDPEYDGWSRTLQSNYELGRLTLAEMHAARIKPISWPSANKVPEKLLPHLQQVHRDLQPSAFGA